MLQKKNKFDFATDEMKKKYLNDIIGFFQNERGEEIGVIAAEEILTFFIDTVGEEIYQKGITDCKKVVKEGMNNIEADLDMITLKT
jgi:uncharacterized protein (DUF2164 family)